MGSGVDEEEIDEVIETDPDEEDHHPIVDDDADHQGEGAEFEEHENADLAYDSHYFRNNQRAAAGKNEA